MVKNKIVAYNFKKLRLENFPASCTYIASQQDFEKETHTVSLDGTMYVNTQTDGWEVFLNVCQELAKMTRYELDKAFKLKKSSKLTEDILFCNLVKLEKERRNVERKYYFSK